MMITIFCFTWTVPLNPGRDESRPLLTAKHHVLLAVVRSTDKVALDVVHVILVLHEKERSHVCHEARKYMMVAPADFAKFITV